jgi:hypothetical protein
MILPYLANLGRMEFSKRTAIRRRAPTSTTRRLLPGAFGSS